MAYEPLIEWRIAATDPTSLSIRPPKVSKATGSPYLAVESVQWNRNSASMTRVEYVTALKSARFSPGRLGPGSRGWTVPPAGQSRATALSTTMGQCSGPGARHGSRGGVVDR